MDLYENIGYVDQIEDMFCSKMYAQTMATCWHLPTYQIQISILKELQTLQQKHIIPNYVTVEDMTDLIAELGKVSLREQLCRFDLEMLDDEDEKLFFLLAWRVNVRNKMWDLVLDSKLTVDPSLTSSESHRDKIRTLCRRYVSTLNVAAIQAHSEKLTTLTDVVLAVVPKVLYDLWVHPPVIMASEKLGKMSVSVTKAVLDQISQGNIKYFFFISFSRVIRDKLVQNILDSITGQYSADILKEKIQGSAPELLRKVVNIAAERIRPMFPAPIIPEPAPIRVAEEGSEEWFMESAVILPEDANAQAEAETKPIPGNSGFRVGVRMLFFQLVTSLSVLIGRKVHAE